MEKVLVFSAHAADFVWRAGGTIAKYLENGDQVKLIIISLGVRGESNHLWKEEGQTYENVAAIRTKEASDAAKILGVTDIEFWNEQDYPMRDTPELENRIYETIRRFRPTVILTHAKNDILNPDHNLVHEMVWRCSIMSNSNGIRLEGTTVTKQMKIYGFEPHQTELSGYKPTTFIDVTSTADKKIAAMNCFKAQPHLISYYTDRLSMRGNHAKRVSGIQTIKAAESFESMYPSVVEYL